MFDRITLGLPKPEKEPASINEMRVAIDRAGRDSSLISRSLDMARYMGLSGEDTYAHLAYFALRELEKHWQMNLQHVNLMPAPPMIIEPLSTDPNTGSAT